MQRLHTSILALAFLAACGTSSPAVAPDAGSDAGPDCESAANLIGPAGGSLTLCDATISVAAGQLTEPTAFSIERVAAVPAIPAPFAVVGEAWRISPEHVAATVQIELAHGSDRPLELARLEGGGWNVFGACEQTETALSASAQGELGIFAAITDARDLPESPLGIGQAEVDVTFGGHTMHLSTGAEGFLTDEPSLTGMRTFALHAINDAHALSLEIAILSDGTTLPLLVVLEDLAQSESWSMDVFTRPDAVAAEASYAAGAVDAVLEGELYRDEETSRGVAISFTGDAGAWWREPPRICVGELTE